MKPSLFHPDSSADARTASPEDIPTGERDRSEILAELAILTRSHLCTTILGQLKLVVSTYPGELQSILLEALPQLGPMIEQGERVADLLGQLTQQAFQDNQRLRDEIADLRREFAVLRRHAEEPPEMAEAEERGRLDIRGCRTRRGSKRERFT